MTLAGWDKNKVINCTISAQPSALTDFPALLNLTTNSGVTGFDCSAVFDALTPLNVNDDFTGVDGDAPDARLWSGPVYGATDTQGATNDSIQGNTLDFSLSLFEDYEGIVSNFLLSGDFDVQVDFAMDNTPTVDSSWAFGINVQPGTTPILGTDYATIGRYAIGVGPYRANCDGGTADVGGSADLTGKFRITRVGTVCTQYYWSGSSWVQLHVDSSYPTSDVYVQLFARIWTQNNNLNCNFDNFTVNSGTVVWPTTPKKLAVEFGDTGVQCYVEIEQWDYVNKSAQLHVRVPSVGTSVTQLQLYYDPTHADNDSRLPADVSDDFTGTDGEYPSAELWDQAGLTISGNKLRGVATTADPWWTTRSVYRVSGDFDAQVDFSDIVAASTQYWYCSLFIQIDSTNHFMVRREFSGGTNRYMSYEYDNGVVENATTSSSTNLSGKFRVERVGDVFTGYFWNGTGWTQLGSGTLTGASGKPVRMSMAVTCGDTCTSCAVNFDNFIINSADSISGLVGEIGSLAAQGVWGANFAAVYHMAQDPSVGGACILDSTANANHGTPVGTWSSADLVDGLCGKALHFAGAGQYIAVPDAASLDLTDAIGLSALFNQTDGTNHGIVCKGPLTDSQGVYQLSAANVGPVHDFRLNGSTTEGDGQVSGGLLADDVWYTLDGAYDGVTQSLYRDGSLVTSAAYSTAIANDDATLNLGAYYDEIYTFDGLIEHIRVYASAPSAVWVAATDNSLRDALIAFSLPGGLLRQTIDMLYSDLLADNRAGMEMIYSILFPHMATVDMLYSMRLGAMLTMYYGDCPTLRQISMQHYGDCPILRRAMEMKYGDLLMLRRSVEMPYVIPRELRSIIEARYSIAGEAVRAFIDQGYDLLDNNLLRRRLDMPYLVQGDNLVQLVGAAVTIGERPVRCSHLNVEASIDDYCISAEIHLADEAEYVQIERGEKFVVQVNDDIYQLIVEAKRRSEPAPGQITYIVTGLSPACQLASPWSRPLLQEFEAGQAQGIVNELVGDLGPVDWQIVDFPILPDTLYANDEDRLTVIRKIIGSAGGIMQSDPDGTIRIVPAYPVSPPQWSTVEPDFYLSGSDFVSQDETPLFNPGHNKFLVGNQLSADDRIWPEKRDVTGSIKEVLGFQTPWDDSLVLVLEHSGGDWVQDPEYMGVIETIYPPAEDPAEKVEFVAGFANASRPIYDNPQVTWIREQLGAISYAEDGQLEAEYKTGPTDGYSLAEIRYLTRYHLWRVRDDLDESVQFIIRRVEEVAA